MPRPAVSRPLCGLAAFLAFSCLAAKRESWVEVRSPNFIVVSNAGEKQARKTALQFEEIRQVFRQSLKVASSHPSPVITIIAAKDNNTMKVLLPEDYVKGHAHHAGYFVDRMNIYFAVVNVGPDSANAFETLYHEYYHSVTVPYFPNLPLWVAEGLAEFYGHTRIDEKSAGMGEPDANLLAELRSEPLIPLPALFSADQSSPYYNEDHKTSIFYAESWALTHYLMVGDREAHRPAFIAYLRAIDEGKSQQDAAAEAFGDLNKLQSALMNYLRSAAFYYIRVPVVTDVRDTDLKVRPISEAEAEAYEAGFAVIRGRTKDGEQMLHQVLSTDAKIPLAYEYLAISQFLDGDHDGALKSASAAIDLDPNNAITRFLYAQLASMGGGLMSGSPQIEDNLRKAIALNPNLSPAYALLGVYLAMHSNNLPEALSFAQKAASFEPGNANYQLALAQVLARMQKFDDAHMAALRAQAWARHPQERANAAAFLSYIQKAKEYQATGAQNVAGETTDDDTAPVIDTVRGTVSNGRCDSRLALDLQTQDGVLHLRGRPNNAFGIAIDGGAMPNFNPCTSLNGLQVEIRYAPDDHKGETGVIRFLRVFASEGDAGLPPGAAIVEGTVSSVTCKEKDMGLRLLLATGKTILLHSTDYAKINYLAGANSSLGDLDPCSELKGRAVKITYAVTNAKSSAGEMQTIVVGK